MSEASNAPNPSQQGPLFSSVYSRQTGYDDVDKRNNEAYEEMIAIPAGMPAVTGDEALDISRMEAYKRRTRIKQVLFPASTTDIHKSMESMNDGHKRKFEKASKEYEAKRKKLEEDHRALCNNLEVENTRELDELRVRLENEERIQNISAANDRILQWVRDLKTPSTVKYVLDSRSKKMILKRDWMKHVVDKLYYSDVLHRTTGVTGVTSGKSLVSTYSNDKRSSHTPGYCAVSTRGDILIVAEFMDTDVLKTLGSLVDIMHADSIKNQTAPCEFVAILPENEIHAAERFNRHGIRCWWKDAPKEHIGWLDSVIRVAQEIS